MFHRPFKRVYGLKARRKQLADATELIEDLLTSLFTPSIA